MYNLKMLFKIILYGFLIYAFLVLGLFLFQRKLIYHPMREELNPQIVGLKDTHKTSIKAEDGTQLSLWWQAPQNNLPIIVYFHGNAGNLKMRADKFHGFIAQNFGLVAISYRGYGDSMGTPSEAGIYMDARAAIKFAQTQFPQQPIILYGESLGSGVAVQMASEFPAQMLVLEAPYTSISARGAELYPMFPIKYITRDNFNSLEKIPHLKMPLLIFHGAKDEVIPLHQGQRLLAAAPEPKKGLFYPDIGHTDFPPALLAQEIINFYHELGFDASAAKPPSATD